MAKFVYIGKCESDYVEMYGKRFPAGEQVVIDEKEVAYTFKRFDGQKKAISHDVLIVDKLRANSAFKEVKPGRPSLGNQSAN